MADTERISEAEAELLVMLDLLHDGLPAEQRRRILVSLRHLAAFCRLAVEQGQDATAGVFFHNGRLIDCRGNYEDWPGQGETGYNSIVGGAFETELDDDPDDGDAGDVVPA